MEYLYMVDRGDEPKEKKNYPTTTNTTTTLTTKICNKYLKNIKSLNIRQTRRGWLQELLLGCEAIIEFKIFTNITDNNNGNRRVQIAYGLEETDCLCRICCRYVIIITYGVCIIHIYIYINV